MCVHPSRTNLKLLPHCCPPFASSSTWPGATASQGFWGGEVAMTSNIFRPQLKRNHQSGLSNQIFIKKIGDKVQNALLTLWGISWVERTSKTIGKIGTGSKSFEALIKAFYLQTLELFPNGLIMEEQLHIFGSLPDLEFVKKFTRPNFPVKEFYTLKTRKSRLFLPAIKQRKCIHISNLVIFLFLKLKLLRC